MKSKIETAAKLYVCFRNAAKPAKGDVSNDESRNMEFIKIQEKIDRLPYLPERAFVKLGGGLWQAGVAGEKEIGTLSQHLDRCWQATMPPTLKAAIIGVEDAKLLAPAFG